jgi:cell division septal protein FtsQ
MIKLLRLLFFFIIVASLFVFFICNFFQVKKVIVSHVYEDIRGLTIFEKKSLFFIDTNKSEKLLLDLNPKIREIKIKKVYPHSLAVNIVLRQPVAKIQKGETEIGVDKDGIILFETKVKGMKLPYIQMTDGSLKVSGLTDWRIVKAAKIIYLLSQESIELDQILLNNEQNLIDIYLEDTEIVAPYIIDPAVFSASLQVIVHRFRIEGKNIRKIDFRFEKPIVQLVNEDKNSSQ